MTSYHPSTYVLEPTAVEETVCKPLANSKYINSTADQLDNLQLIMVMGSNENAKLMLENICDGKKYPQYAGVMKGFYDRVQTFPILFDYKLIAWIVTHYSTVGIGGWLLVAYYLEWWAFKKGMKKLSLSRVMREVFAVAVLSPDALHEVWDNQKVRSQPDNLIDYASALQSFMPGYEINY